MLELIGQSLDFAKKFLNEKGISYQIIENNHNVVGDTILVTNVKILDEKSVVLTVGKFIFDLKDWLFWKKLMKQIFQHILR